MIIIIYRCAAGFYEEATPVAACSACPVKCSTCTDGTTCTACAASTADAPTNRVTFGAAATDCAYLF